MPEPTSYTKIPRATMWLLQEDDFEMGGEQPNAQPSFTTYAPSFYISKAPITNEQYEAFQPDFVRAKDSSDDAPAVGITLLEATDYCAWYSRISKKEFRLPTEIEWEFACRGGTAGPYFMPPENADKFIWSAENSGERLQLAESLRANPAGLHNMLGNIWEWTSSTFSPYPLANQTAQESTDPNAQYVLRGGSFRIPLAEIGAGIRRQASARFSADDLGFRIVRSL